MLGDERAGVRYAINGLISMTPDGHPVLGETPEVPGLWSVAASWIKEGPGIGRAVAEWMSGVTPEIDIHEADIARFYPHQRTTAHVTARAREGFNKMYGIVHPAEQWESGRPVRVSPVYERERELGAVFHETAGWERPFWYERNRDLLDRYRGQLMDRGSEWESRWWSPIINAEHLAMRERAGLFDLSAFAILDVTGPGALHALQKVAVAQMQVPVGRVVYTSFLDDAGGFRADLTIMRLGPRHFRVVTGGATGMSDYKWITDHLPDDGSAAVTDVTSAWTTFGLWGPKARDILGHLTGDDISNAGFPFGTCRDIEAEGMTVLASRISYVGRARLGAVRAGGAGRRSCGTRLFSAGLAYGMVPAGIGVYGTTGRLEKGYRAYGAELDASYSLVEAGMTGRRSRSRTSSARPPTCASALTPPAAVLCTLTVDDHVSDYRRAAVHAGRRAGAVRRRRAADRRAGAAIRT